MPTLSNLFYRYVSDEVDLASTGDHEIGTTSESGIHFHPIGAQAVITDKSGTILTGAVCSVGTNSSSYNNLVTAMTTGGALDDLTAPSLGNSFDRIPYNTAMRAKISVGATGGGVLKGKFIVWGFYQ